MDESGDADVYLETQVDKFTFRVRRDYLYTPQDVWVKMEDGKARIGLTDYLQRSSGDVTIVTFSPEGSSLLAGATLAEVETIKTTLEVPSPLSGTVVGLNEALLDRPELINEDPYGEGWLVSLAPPGDSEPPGLLAAAAYFALMQQKLAAGR